MSDPVDSITLKLGDLVTQPSVPDPAADVSTEPGLVKSTYDVQVKLADQQADPNSPLFSVKSFEQLKLSPQLLKGVYTLGFSKPSKIQERALPLLLSNPAKNMIGQSQSGTGKTAAFVISMLTRIDPNRKCPQAICLAPSRELATQIYDVVKSMAEYTDITTENVVSGMRMKPIDAQVIVGTPGKVNEGIKRKNIAVGNVKMFVLDEADNMLDQDGLGDQTIRIKSKLKVDSQIVLFSATFPDHVRKFAEKFAPNANEITLKREDLNVKSIKQFYMDCDSKEHKYECLVKLYQMASIPQSVIFCKTRASADEIQKRMKEEGHEVCCLHGKMLPEDRDKMMDEFRTGRYKVLITTNVLARGIDIAQVSLVVNYDLPTDGNGKTDFEAYLHRIGRTGRFGRSGVSVNLIDSPETWQQMDEIEKHFHLNIALLPTDDWEKIEKTLSEYIK